MVLRGRTEGFNADAMESRSEFAVALSEQAMFAKSFERYPADYELRTIASVGQV